MDPFVVKPSKVFTEVLYEGGTDVRFTNKVAFCVRYLCQEAFCVPPILHYEMARAVVDDIQHRDPNERVWMN